MQTPVLVLAHRLIGIDTLPSPQAFENGRFLIVPFWRYQDTYGLTDHFVGGIAEQALCTLIPAGDYAVQILGHNRIVRRLDDSGETTRIALGIAAPLDLSLEILLEYQEPIDNRIETGDEPNQQERNQNERQDRGALRPGKRKLKCRREE